MYPFAYIAWCGVFALVWVLFFYFRPEIRKNMVLLSLFVTPLGPLTQYLHTFDYWRPETITGTLIGPEDFIIAFLIGGITAGVYSLVQNREHVRRARASVLPLVLAAYVLGIALMYGGFFFLGISSVEVAILTLGLFGILPCIMKPWILKGAVLSSVIFGLFLFGFEALYFAVFPGIVDAWWFGASWGRLAGVPYEEIVWGLLWGLAGASGSELVARIKLPSYIR